MKKQIYIFVFLLIFAGINYAQNLDSGLVGKWLFTGNALNSMGYENHGTINGATLTTSLQVFNHWTKLNDSSAITNVIFSRSPYNHDRVQNKIYFIDYPNSKIYCYNLNSNSFSQITVGNWLSGLGTMACVYDPVNNRIIATRSGTDVVYAVSAAGGNWTQVGTGGFDALHYEANYYWNRNSNSFGFFGGYGGDIENNCMYENNLTGSSWILKRGNTNTGNPPRFRLWVSMDSTGNYVYLFGGFGNLTGSQYSCSLTYWYNGNDYCWTRGLWKINLSDYSVTTLLPLDDPRIVCDGNIAYDYKRNTFYSLLGLIKPTSGNIINTYTNNTYKYTPETDSTFNLVTVSGTPPPIDNIFGTAYFDAANDRIIYFRRDGVWSLSAQTLLVPILISPQNNSVDLSLTPVLVWNALSEATGYKVNISTDSNFVSITDSATVTTNQYSIPSGKLSYNTKYYWKVAGYNTYGTGQYSTAWNFTTLNPLPLQVTLLSPANGSSNVTLTPTLFWNTAANATSYRVQVSPNSAFSYIVDSATVTTNQRTIPAGKINVATTYYWRVQGVNSFGNGTWSSAWNFFTIVTAAQKIGIEVPTEYKLYDNYPNPFNPVTKIKFDIPHKSYVKLEVFDISGKKISELINQEMTEGMYETKWDASNFASGIYFYKITAGEFKKVMKMILIK